jgi:hypothetical protein
MSWKIRYEQTVESCDECPLYIEHEYDAVSMVEGYCHECAYDVTIAPGRTMPSEIRPCPLKVEE